VGGGLDHFFGNVKIAVVVNADLAI
jgi:hypothetical protein